MAQPVEHRVFVVAQDAEPGLRNDDRGVRRRRAVLIFAISEEGEVVLIEPPEKSGDLVDLAGRQGQRAIFELLERVGERLAHAWPVDDGAPHVVEHGEQQGRDRLATLLVALLADFDMHQRFAQDAGTVGSIRAVAVEKLGEFAGGSRRSRDRVNDEMDDEVEAVQRHGHRVDEKRHVVVDDLDDRAGRVPAVLGGARVEHAQLGVARFALLGERPERGRGPVKIRRVAREHVFRWDMGVELADDPGERIGLGVGQAMIDQASDALDQLPLALFTLQRHRSFPPRL